jgi:uncharacterized OB-fold protein
MGSVEGTYLGMALSIDELDGENLAYFRSCAEGRFRLQRGRESGLLRYPPTTACPWTGDRAYDWVPVDPRGSVHTYTEVHHAIQPSFRPHTPYLVLVVDLDTQKGEPTEHEALRVVGNLVTPDGDPAPPDLVERVGIGTRVRMVFVPVEGSDELAIPNWTIDETAEQPAEIWRYPG